MLKYLDRTTNNLASTLQIRYNDKDFAACSTFQLLTKFWQFKYMARSIKCDCGSSRSSAFPQTNQHSIVKLVRTIEYHRAKCSKM